MRDFYLKGYASPSHDEVPPAPAGGPKPFAWELSEANRGQGYWEAGWEVQAVEGEWVTANSRGLRVLVPLGQCMPANGEGMRPGEGILVRSQKELPKISPGFYMALSDKPLDDNRLKQIVRFYWHIAPQGAAWLVGHITSELNAAHLAFKLKVLDDPGRYSRCDAAVLYTDKQDHATVSELLAGIYPQLADYMQNSIPALTKPLARGLGFAEDPGEGESFGQHRCRILADGIIRAYEAGKKRLEEGMLVVEERFAEAGIGLQAPYLNPSSSDTYDFPLGPSVYPLAAATAAVEGEQDYVDGDLLVTALAIGRRICRDAIWYGERCTWTGAQGDEQAYLKGQPSLKYSTLGPDLYDGTAGIGLFLAALYSLTGEEEEENCP